MAESQSDDSQSMRLASKVADGQQQHHLTQAGGSSAQAHPLVPDEDMPASELWSTQDDGWSIACPYTMTSCHTESAVATGEPEIDIIDGESFISFETWEHIDKYTRQNQQRHGTPGTGQGVRLQCDKKSAATSSSAFVSKSLDEFLMQESGRSPLPSHNASLPPQSRIYETGILKMDSVRKPFADLPHLHPVRDNASAPLVPPPPLLTIVTENHPLPQRAVIERLTRPPVKRKITALQDFDAGTVTAEEMEAAVNRLFREAAKQSLLSRKSRYVSIRMDESYSAHATNALTTPSSELPEHDSPDKKIKKSNKKVKNNDDSAFSPTKSAKETDLIAMISRKRDSAKRDIRLPSRYQESALVEGNSWICAAPFGNDIPTDKRPRKRLIDEQRRLLVLTDPLVNTPKIKPHILPKDKIPAKRKLQPHANRTLIPPAKILASAEMKLPNLTPMPQRPIHRQPAIPVPAGAVATMRPKITASGTTEGLKESYRELFYACGTGRREHFRKKCLKPRVNKAKTVDEAIEVIKKLELRERQLLYIKQLLSLWHHKLDLCSQVIADKVRPEPNPNKDTRTVVLSVLKAYRDSFCYKLSARLPLYLTQAKHPEQQQTVPIRDQVRMPESVINGVHPESQGADLIRSRSVSGTGVGSGDKAQMMKRKKMRSQSLLIRKQLHKFPHPLLVPEDPAAAGDASRGRGGILNVSDNAYDVLKDGKPCKQFIWANNHQIQPDQLIPKNGSESTRSSHIMSSST